MIKFFRKIRQNLLMENKTGKYFKYAIGEIVLVVIGILIALQINNWNENRKQASKTKHLIERLIIETKQNIQNIKLEIEHAQKVHKEIKTILLMFGETINEDQNTKMDSLLAWIAPDYALNLNLNTLIEARDNGEVSLIKSDTLRARLYRLGTIYDHLKDFEKMTNDDNNNFMMPFIYKNTNRRNIHAKIWKSEIGISKLEDNDYSLLLTNRELENLLNARFNYSIEILNRYLMLEEFLNNLKQLLEQGNN